MNIIKYKCLEGFQRRYNEADTSPELSKLSAFSEILKNDFSGENIVARIVDTSQYWEEMLNTKGFGRGKKYFTAQSYRRGLIMAWSTIKNAFETGSEAEISELMGLYLWDLGKDEFTHSYLGVIEGAMKKSRLWRSPVASEIFCSFFGFVQGQSKTVEEIAFDRNLARERVRQLKVQYLNSFEQDFWFLKDDIVKVKFETLFDLSPSMLGQISEQSKRVNIAEGVHFSREFYITVLALATDVVQVGNVNDIKTLNKRSSNGNVWSNLHLQTKPENERCNLGKLIDDLAVLLHDH